MQAFGEKFAKVYNMRWADFAKRTAPLILDFFEGRPVSRINNAVLDLCCGTGQLAVHFLEQGYKVVGIDLSEHMLQYARENSCQFIESGQARFIQDDASSFELDGSFGLVVSTYDAINHLEDEKALRQCFESVYAVLEEDGYFIFDLNTRLGLLRWNSIVVNDGDKEIMLITRGIYDGESDRAWTKISGFIHSHDNLYERFEETVFNTVFEMEKVRNLLLDIGWRKVHFARVQDLETPVEKPEEEGRVFIVSKK